MSPLLLNLEKSVAETSDPIHRGVLLARKASVHARLGESDVASGIVRELRSIFGDGRSGQVTVWIMLAEGLTHWFSDLNPQALDRITRAQLLGAAMGYDELVACASAWKALIEFNMWSFEAMFASTQLAFAKSHSANHDALARLALNLASAHAYGGNHDSIGPWFFRAKYHAAELGDRTSVEALQHNRTALSLGHLRAEAALDAVSPGSVAAVRREFNSSDSFRRMTGIDVHESRHLLVDARLSVLEGRFADAIRGLAKVRAITPNYGHDLNERAIDVEIAYCHLRVGEVQSALDQMARIDQTSFLELDIDDQLICAWMQHEMIVADARFGDLQMAASRLAELRGAYRRSMDTLRAGLVAYAEPPPLAGGSDEAVMGEATR